ncbi:UNVERIFIED_CONTAM: hypothetical protein K2H54_022617 [Gekko kuhli]
MSSTAAEDSAEGGAPQTQPCLLPDWPGRSRQITSCVEGGGEWARLEEVTLNLQTFQEPSDKGLIERSREFGLEWVAGEPAK